jgi:Zn-dependent protease
VLALLAAAIFTSLTPEFFLLDDGELPLIEIVFLLGFVNVLLAVFNLLPIPPLDGSALIERFLPARAQPSWYKFRQYSMGILLILVLLVPGFFDRVFDPFVDLWIDLLG